MKEGFLTPPLSGLNASFLCFLSILCRPAIQFVTSYGKYLYLHLPH